MRIVSTGVAFVLVVAGLSAQQDSARPLPEPVKAPGQRAAFTVSVSDPVHARLVVQKPESEAATYDATAITMSYAAEGLVVEMKGPGTMTTRGRVVPLDFVRLTFKDGRFVGMQAGRGAIR